MLYMVLAESVLYARRKLFRECLAVSPKIFLFYVVWTRTEPSRFSRAKVSKRRDGSSRKASYYDDAKRRKGCNVSGQLAARVTTSKFVAQKSAPKPRWIESPTGMISNVMAEECRSS